MKKIILILVLVVIIIAVWMFSGLENEVLNSETSTFSSDSLGIKIDYPKEWVANEENNGFNYHAFHVETPVKETEYLEIGDERILEGALVRIIKPQETELRNVSDIIEDDSYLQRGVEYEIIELDSGIEVVKSEFTDIRQVRLLFILDGMYIQAYYKSENDLFYPEFLEIVNSLKLLN